MRKYNYIFTIIMPVILLFNLVSPALAATQKSETVRTSVGDPAVLPPALDGVNSDILKAAIATKLAYDKCSAGYTHARVGLNNCLHDQLLSSGYSEEQIRTFEQRRQGSFADGCTQCLGFIGIVTSLITGTTDTFKQGYAGAVTENSYTFGGITFVKIPNTEKLQPGDIGVNLGYPGHILFVKRQLDDIRFEAVESNGDSDCRVTDDKVRLVELYQHFYRVKQ